MNPVLSVVVIGRNEGERLRRCLQSVRDMRSPGGDVEVIYVDSASTDTSVALAESFGARVLAVKPKRPTAALGRNAGWRAATAPVVLFLDGDTILHPDFVADSLPELKGNVAAVWGHRREIHPDASIFNRLLDLDWIYKPGLTEFCGGDVLFQRSALEAVNGYDESLIAGEEPEMCRRLRGLAYTILHVDRPMTGHDLAMTKWSQYWKRATRAGYAYAEVSSRFRGTGLPFWEDDVVRNRNRALTMIAAAAVAVIGSVLFMSPMPALVVAAFYALLVVRSAWKARWKSSNVWTLLGYGIHSHFQQLPIYFGQLQYELDRRKGTSRGLIEYKGAA